MASAGVTQSLHIVGGSVETASMDGDDASIACEKFEVEARLQGSSIADASESVPNRAVICLSPIVKLR